jgi:hypothetical protein
MTDSRRWPVVVVIVAGLAAGLLAWCARRPRPPGPDQNAPNHPTNRPAKPPSSCGPELPLGPTVAAAYDIVPEPAVTGGLIENGTYVLRRLTLFRDKGWESHPVPHQSSTQQTLAVNAGTFTWTVSIAGLPTATYAGTYGPSPSPPNYITWQFTCGPPGHPTSMSAPYSASGDELRLFSDVGWPQQLDTSEVPGRTWPEVLVWSRQ